MHYSRLWSMLAATTRVFFKVALDKGIFMTNIIIKKWSSLEESVIQECKGRTTLSNKAGAIEKPLWDV
ncbi:hypothetical protein OIU79_018607 [Salix purpurea]|uniref:Uncharacterized protein n=1 Tax=Salix purpurea TaxID=77065 RepID=A0A9Q0WXS0_SALPP|nr:hypothetical protein OIU79_018607 [Salix purpurea]